MRNKVKSRGLLLGGGILAVLLVTVLSLCLGNVHFTPMQLLGILRGNEGNVNRSILLYARLPRTLASLFSGAALAVSGAVLQNVLANRLASPGIIGVNAGAGLGVTLCCAGGILSGYAVSLSAFAGSLISVFLIFLFSYRMNASRTTVILSGVALNSILNAVCESVTVLDTDLAMLSIDFRVGGFSAVSFTRLVPAAVLISLALWGLFTLCNELDVVTLGDETARGVGLAVGRYRMIFLVLAALLAGPPQDSGLARIIPAGTRLARWSVENRTALVELSPEYGGLEGIDRTLADYCVALTLCQLPAVDGVRLSAGGGEGRLLRAGDAIFSGAEEEPVDVTAALYFRRAGGNTLGYELRVFRLTEEETPARAVLEALISGPRDEGLSALLPPELTVRAAWVDDGVCYADLSGALLAAPPEQAEEQELLITSIVETLCSLDKVEQVRLLVEGEALTAYGGLDLSGPLLPAKPKDGFAGTPS